MTYEQSTLRRRLVVRCGKVLNISVCLGTNRRRIFEIFLSHKFRTKLWLLKKDYFFQHNKSNTGMNCRIAHSPRSLFDWVHAIIDNLGFRLSPCQTWRSLHPRLSWCVTHKDWGFEWLTVVFLLFLNQISCFLLTSVTRHSSPSFVSYFISYSIQATNRVLCHKCCFRCIRCSLTAGALSLWWLSQHQRNMAVVYRRAVDCQLLG